MDAKTPSQRRYVKIRQGILDAASDLLLESGVDVILMRVLADKVDYSPAALFKYFSSKEEIIEALRQEAWELMADFDPDIPPGISMANMFLLSVRNYVKISTLCPAYYKLIMSTTETGPDSMDEFKDNPAFVDLLTFTRAAVASGEFILPEGYCSTHFALLSWFVVHGISILKLTMMNNCQDEFETASVEVMDMIKEVFVKK